MTPTTLVNPAFEHLRQIPLYVPGKPIQEVQRELGLGSIVKLASNENPWGPTPAVKARVLRAVSGSADEGLGLYPVSDGLYLRTAIANRRGFSPDQVILGNGSSEIIEMAAKAMLLDGGSGVAAKYSFAIYSIATQTAGGTFIESPGNPLELEVETLLAAVRPDTRIVYLGNPNNPTGTMLDRAALAHLVAALREDILLVVDQAYAEYVDPAIYPDASVHLAERANLLVLHTFSKIHCLAGLRIGYGLGRPELLSLLERVRSPFNTNHLAQVAAEVAVQDVAFEAFSREKNRSAREAFLLEAGKHRCQVSGQAGNFLLMETVFPAPELFRDLLKRGVIVRPMQGYGLPNHIRITLGTPEEMVSFWKAIGPILDHAGCGCS
jgi:histidinol-phosphate aminotransferase